MPSDEYYQRIYNSEDRLKRNRKEQLRKDMIDKFNNLTQEEKVNFLIDNYINEELNKLV